ncbi:cell envelope integrity protein TolA [Xenorhabdus griffiniae]|uniref:Cell envelope integrity protein TolA n=1 Tax=Xenorhabdus griffiniae TaxID=351672 RepID=A0ABY9XE21_9GAMM|nr:cell envelope integrity protein TolA [Xenorhabdus griffiniae]MBD1226151.1 cell envelope integrity protein TolA [Xenorhabdus griffiniae]MBE8585972.1 cell envelope integrity protein TolA [Xenorhabdus griffiniae]WMV71166.1 cell envelope integrity protein TolA [Xenorhabdus griffiniae]WNH00842.1 cell envelope integrity protein TolA [Xenorhabdus griffiniae]
MGKTSEQNNRLNRAIIISVILHIILIGFLIWGSWVQKTEMGGGGQSGTVIDAVMVDPNAVVQQYNQQQQQQANAKLAEQQRKKKAEQQAAELRAKQAEEQERLKVAEEERIKALQEAEAQKKQSEAAATKAREEQEQADAAAAKAREDQKQAEEAAAKALAEKERILKEQAEARQKAEAQAKKEAEEAVKRKAAAEAKAKAEAEAEAKAKAEAEEKAKAKAKAKAEAAKQAQTVNDLLGGLTSNTPKQGGATSAGKGGGKKSGPSDSEINNYKGRIQSAIQQNFRDPSLYIGRTCDLNIKLAPDGLLIDIKAGAGDPALCRAAITAANLAKKMPPPPSKEVYEYFKSFTLEFKPQ